LNNLNEYDQTVDEKRLFYTAPSLTTASSPSPFYGDVYYDNDSGFIYMSKESYYLATNNDSLSNVVFEKDVLL
jgi:hypothetical protein